MTIPGAAARVAWWVGAAVLLAGPLLAQDPPPVVRRPNFLFLAVDDLNAMVGFLGDEPGSPLRTLYPDPAQRAAVRQQLTPNLDRLAAAGRPFARAYCPAPLCGPSRTAILTGVPAHRSGYHEHQHNFRDCPPLAEVVTLPQHLRANGYYTVGIGKVFHHAMPTKAADGREIDWRDTERSWDAFPPRHEGGPSPAKDPLPRLCPGGSYIRYGENSTPLGKLRDVENARFVADLLQHGKATVGVLPNGTATVELPADRPFFLACGIFAPHLPWHVPAEFFNRFPTAAMAIDETTWRGWLADLDDVPGAGQRLCALPAGRNDLQRFLDHAVALDGAAAVVPLLRELNQAYLASVAFADHCLGLALDGLAASPRAADTIVVLWGDHGFHLGEKARIGKSALWDEATHTVLVVRAPDLPAPGEMVRGPVSLQDLYATVADLAGLPVPAQVAGQSLRPWLQEPGRAGLPPVLTTTGVGRHAVRDGRWCFIRYGKGQEELYDDLADPDQQYNLASKPEFAAELARLRALLPATEAPLFAPK